MEYIISLAVESYGPVGLLAVFLWNQQRKQTRAIVRLAEEVPGADARKIERCLRPGGD